MDKIIFLQGDLYLYTPFRRRDPTNSDEHIDPTVTDLKVENEENGDEDRTPSNQVRVIFNSNKEKF